MNSGVSQIVDSFWTESIGFLRELLSQPPQTLQTVQIDRAQAFLLQIRDSKNQLTNEKLEDLLDEFYRFPMSFLDNTGSWFMFKDSNYTSIIIPRLHF